MHSHNSFRSISKIMVFDFLQFAIFYRLFRCHIEAPSGLGRFRLMATEQTKRRQRSGGPLQWIANIHWTRLFVIFYEITYRFFLQFAKFYRLYKQNNGFLNSIEETQAGCSPDITTSRILDRQKDLVEKYDLQLVAGNYFQCP